MFGATGAGLAAVKGLRNDGKKPRWNIDQWDRVSRFQSSKPSSEPESASDMSVFSAK
jgi:NADH-ubiquinone oxidoreductase MWFE subunit